MTFAWKQVDRVLFCEWSRVHVVGRVQLAKACRRAPPQMVLKPDRHYLRFISSKYAHHARTSSLIHRRSTRVHRLVTPHAIEGL